MTTEAQMVLNAMQNENVQTFIGLLVGLGPKDVSDAVNEITEELI